MDELEIRVSDIHGREVFATRTFAAGKATVLRIGHCARPRRQGQRLLRGAAVPRSPHVRFLNRV
jgi:hypothetical protein